MFRLLTFLVIARILCTFATNAPYNRGRGGAIEGEYVVHFHEGHDLDKHFAHIGKSLGDGEGLHIHNWLPGYRATLDDHTVHELVRRDPGVKLVENNAEASIPRRIGSTKGYLGLNDSELQTLDKRDFNGVHVWPCPDNLVMVQAGKKLPKEGRDSVYDMLRDAGLGVRAYVLDTGIRLTHDRFRGRAVNFRNYRSSPYTVPRTVMGDIDGHGTHVAGILGSFQWGVAERATLVNVKVLNDTGHGKLDMIAQAINDVREEHIHLRSNNRGEWRGSVINLSLSSGESAASLETAIQRAVNEGIPVVSAAGNGQLQPDGETYKGIDANNIFPCAYSEVICVGAVDVNYQAASWSNFGRKVTYLAPGVDIASMSHTGDTTLWHDSGTSQAVPHVSGMLAIFTYWEAMGYNSDFPPLAQVRLEQNFLDGITVGFPRRQLNRFPITGNHHPDKDPYVPYNGAPGRPAKGLTSGNDSANAVPSSTVSWSSVIYPNAATYESGDPTDDPTIDPLSGPTSPSVTFSSTFSSIAFSFDPTTTSTSAQVAKRTPFLSEDRNRNLYPTGWQG